jgi:hypothetical protein
MRAVLDTNIPRTLGCPADANFGTVLARFPPLVSHRLESFPQVEDLAAVGDQSAQSPLPKCIEPGHARAYRGLTVSAIRHVLPCDVYVAWAAAMDCLAGTA